MFGLESENFLGKSAYAFFNKDDITLIIEYHDKMAEQGEIIQEKTNSDDGVVYRIHNIITEEKYTWVHSKTLVVGDLFYSYTQYASNEQIMDLYFKRYGIKISEGKLSSAKILTPK